MLRRGTKSLAVFIAVFISLLSPPAAIAGAPESGCIACHTSAKKLIEVTRELAASRPSLPKHAESKGEG
jgi:hypothetical protein